MSNFENDIKEAVQTLENGGLILYPTDTVWGIGCDATNAAAVSKIYALKKRSDEKAMIVLMADEKQLMKYITQPDPSVFDHLATVSKPTTVIYEGAVGLATNLIANDGSVGIRLVKDDFCRTLIRRFRKPIVSTSANISGEITPSIFSEIGDAIKNGVDLIVEYRREDLAKAQPSAVIRLGKGGAIIVLRP